MGRLDVACLRDLTERELSLLADGRVEIETGVLVERPYLGVGPTLIVVEGRRKTRGLEPAGISVPFTYALGERWRLDLLEIKFDEYNPNQFDYTIVWKKRGGR